MYEAYWQLNRKPFQHHAEPAFYYPCEGHQGALLKLRYAIEGRRGGAVVAGEAGTGKSLLLHQLSRQLGTGYAKPVHLTFTLMPPAELLATIAAELTGTSPGGTSVPSLDRSISAIKERLMKNENAGLHSLLIVDEAQLLDGHESFEMLRLLMNFTSERGPLMTLILVGQTSLLIELERLPHFSERLEAVCILRPFSLDETISYAQHRLRAAGARREIVSVEAWETLFQLSGGIPRRINRLCDMALLVGYAEERNQISASHFESIAHELITLAAERRVPS